MQGMCSRAKKQARERRSGCSAQNSCSSSTRKRLSIACGACGSTAELGVSRLISSPNSETGSSGTGRAVVAWDWVVAPWFAVSQLPWATAG